MLRTRQNRYVVLGFIYYDCCINSMGLFTFCIRMVYFSKQEKLGISAEMVYLFC